MTNVDYDFATGRALREVQLERLRATLAHAEASVPHYARAFAEHGVTARDLRSLEDPARFPFTTKADLRATYPFGMSRCRGEGSRASTPRRPSPVSLLSSVTPPATSPPGRGWSHGRSTPPGSGRG